MRDRRAVERRRRVRPGACSSSLGPSGVGKDTIIARCSGSSRADPTHYVVTCTTRPVASTRSTACTTSSSVASSRRLRDDGDPRGDRGPRQLVRDAARPGPARSLGRDAILKIDVQGAQVEQKVPEALLMFLVPPSLEDLFREASARATESADDLDIRQRNAALELARQEDYDHVVRNETGQVGEPPPHRRDHHRREGRPDPDRRTRV